MKSKAIFYHAGCPVCIEIVKALDLTRYDLEITHLGDRTDKIAEAKAKGVQSVPALVLDNQAFHINFGATLADLT